MQFVVNLCLAGDEFLNVNFWSFLVISFRRKFYSVKIFRRISPVWRSFIKPLVERPFKKVMVLVQFSREFGQKGNLYKGEGGLRPREGQEKTGGDALRKEPPAA